MCQREMVLGDEIKEVITVLGTNKHQKRRVVLCSWESSSDPDRPRSRNPCESHELSMSLYMRLTSFLVYLLDLEDLLS